MKFRILCILVLTVLVSSIGSAQMFTQQDSLRGSITPERAWWDLTFYDLQVKVEPEERLIEGSNTIRYKVLKPHQVLQVDLQQPLKILSIQQDEQPLSYISKGYSHFVTLEKPQLVGEINEIVITYSGNPRAAIRAPWDGGFSWSMDRNGHPFVATSCQGLGASVWWPNKDHMYDEVDSMAISVTVPKDLVAVANGRLKKVREQKDTKTYDWYVRNPINNYGVNVNIGDYVSYSETLVTNWWKSLIWVWNIKVLLPMETSIKTDI